MNESTQSAPASSNPVDTVVKVFTDPQKAFEQVKAKPTWLLPILISIIVGLAFTYLTQDIQAEMQRDFIMESERYTEEQKDMILENMENPGAFMKNVMPALGVVVWSFVAPLGIALGMLIFGNFIFGGQSTFKMNFVVAAWAGLIGALEALIKLPLVLAKGSMHVYTSLAVFMDPSEFKTVTFGILNLVDIFSIWKIIVYAIGFSVIYKFARNKGYITLVVLYLIYGFAAIGFTQLFAF